MFPSLPPPFLLSPLLPPSPTDVEEEFLVLPKDKAELTSDLETCRELLTSGERLSLKLDRNLQVFRPSFRATNFDLPDSFFNLSVDEIRREQKLK